MGTFEGSVVGTRTQVYRSGLLNAGFRLSVNLKGGPAMPVQQFVKWKQRALLGLSLKVIAPNWSIRSQETRQFGALIAVWRLSEVLGIAQRQS